MLKNKILEKLLAIIIIFTLTSVNFAFVGEAYASTITDVLFGKSDTGNKNVGFAAYFGAEDEGFTSVVSDVNNDELAISMKLSVENSGYLKDAEIKIAETEEEKGINFTLKEIEELPEYVQSIENNTIKLQQINNSYDEISLLIPIEYKNEKYFDESNLSKDFSVLLTGTYIDGKGKENEISKEEILTLTWKDEREIEVETEIEKYVDFGEGIIVQSKVTVDSSTEKNTLPVKETEITIDVPKLDEVSPSNVYVVPNSTMGTNGESVGETNFSEENWEYNPEESKLTIKVNNEKQLVVFNEFEDEFLQEEDQELVEEERYYNLPGSDEYLITYTYDDVEAADETFDIDYNVEAKMTLISENVITNDDEYKDSLEEVKGNIVSLNVENVTENVSKAYLYSNLNSAKYEVELNSKTIINVSHKEMVEELEVEDLENTYVTVDGTSYNNEDIYYKQISISKENFEEMLGEAGKVEIYNLAGNQVAVIDNESSVDESGNMFVNFEEKYSRLVFKVSGIVGEGNIVINNNKVIKGLSLNKEQIVSLDHFETKASLKVDFDLVDEKIETDTVENSINLTNTETKVNLYMDRDSLSTLSDNTGVKFTLELNNATDKSDLYGHTEINVVLPENVEEINITDTSMLFEEGLEISSINASNNVISIILEGKQTEINSGVVTNGTNIVIEADLKVNVFTPAKTDVISVQYNNNEATNYNNEGKLELPISFSAPKGLITASNIYNYNDNGNTVTSVNQGKTTDLINVYSSAKVSTMELVVMNNNSNKISDFSILGRFPYEGVTDITTGDELGTTLNPTIVSGIVSKVENVEFNVYYSSNPNATKDLNNEENGWSTELEGAKSFLILPKDENYLMEEYEVLRFSYEFEIPENLTHNENIYGTFVAYYTNLSDVAISRQESTPDLVGITTGPGPSVELYVSANKEKVREYEELQIELVAKNTGKEKAEDIRVEFEIPENTTYERTLNEKDGIIVNYEDGKLVVTITELQIGEELGVTAIVKANLLSEEDVTEKEIELNATITAKDLGAILNAKTSNVTIESAEFEVTETNKVGARHIDIYTAGYEFIYTVVIRNIQEGSATNVVATKVLPEELELISAISRKPGQAEVEAKYDSNTRTITWNIDEIESYGIATLEIKVRVNELPENVTEKVVSTNTKVSADNSDEYESNLVTIDIGKPVLEIKQTTDTTNTYVKEGSIINYTFKVKNTGSAQIDNVVLKEIIPEGLNVKSIDYELDSKKASKSASSKSEATVKAIYIAPNSELTVNVKAIAAGLNGVQEKTVTNYAYVSAEGMPEVKSDSITHIIEASEKDAVAATLESSSSSTKGRTQNSSANITKTYKITGTAWVDENKDGTRSENEELLVGISAKLVNNDNGKIIKTVTTDATGSYTFAGIENGNYVIIFDYDTVKYAITTYHKEGVGDNVNSDVVSTKVEQNGVTRNAAITDIIIVSNGSVSGVDIGLILADVFDLKIDKTITKVTVQTVNGVSTDTYDGIKMVKTEIAAKYLAGATVYVEYEIKVSNVGDIAGYAKKIIDYIPEGMTFNSTLGDNAKWYTSSSNDLITDELANKQLTSGESASIKLVLTRQMTTDNTDIVNNMAEIYEDYNIYGVSDTNSTPANKAQGENDLSSADIAIMVKTGETFINISVVMMTLLLMIIVAVVVHSKVAEILRRKEGV